MQVLCADVLPAREQQNLIKGTSNIDIMIDGVMKQCYDLIRL